MKRLQDGTPLYMYMVLTPDTKGQVIRATFSHNPPRNTATPQAEKGRRPHHHPRPQPATQQISMLQVAAL